MSKVFMSYARKDHDSAQQVMGVLQQAGINISSDQSIKMDENWKDTLETVLTEAQACVLLISPASVKLPLVKHEYQHFMRHGKPIYPVIIEPVSPDKVPHVLRRYQHLDMADNPTMAAEQLVQSIKAGHTGMKAASAQPRLVLEMVRNRFHEQREEIFDTMERLTQDDNIDEIVIRFVEDDE